MRPKIIGISGHARSGKTFAADYLRSEYGVTVLRNSEPLGEVISRLKAMHNRETYIEIATALFEVFGNDMLAHHWLRRINATSSTQVYVVEGIRYPEEVVTYRESADFFLLGIESSDTNRFNRAQLASDLVKDSGCSYEGFLAQKALRSERFVDSIVSRADRVIVNNESTAQFTALIDSAVANLL